LGNGANPGKDETNLIHDGIIAIVHIALQRAIFFLLIVHSPRTPNSSPSEARMNPTPTNILLLLPSGQRRVDEM
jgi:hypothetical protein